MIQIESVVLYSAIGIALAIYSFRQYGLLPFPTIIIIIFAVSYVMFGLVSSGNLDFPFFNTFSRNGFLYNYHSINTLYILTSILMLALSPRDSMSFDFKDAILDNREAIGRVVPAGSMICGGLILTAVLLVNWPYVLQHFGYLSAALLADAQDRPVLSLDPAIHRTAAFAINLFAPPMAFLFVIAGTLGKGSRLLRIPIGIFLVISYMIALGGSSRSAAFTPGTLAVAYFLIARNLRSVKVISLLAVTVVTLLYTLTARSQNEQGLLAIPGILASVFDVEFGSMVARLLLSFTEGIFVTSEGVSDNRFFDQTYALLSLSPLPSSIDGFDEVRDIGQNRLSTYAPMSGVGELVHFGIFPIIYVILVFVAAIRWSFSLQKRSPIIFIVTNFLIMFAIYHLFAYPTRNALRFIWLCFAILAAAAFLKPPSRAKGRKAKSVGIDPALRARNGRGLRSPGQVLPHMLPPG